MATRPAPSDAREHEFPSIAALFFAGMFVPFVVALRSHEILSMYVSGDQFAVLSAAVFGVVVWLLIARFDLDRMDLVFASLTLPWFFSILLVLLVGVPLDVEMRYVLSDFDSLLVYASAFTVAGVTVAALHRGGERLSGAYDWMPSPGTLAVVVAAGVVATVVVGGAVAHVTANSASVSNVEQVTLDRETPGLNVTVEGERTELRLTVTAPDNSTKTQRISHSDMADGEATVSIEDWQFDASELQAGTYHVEVTAISGATVDTASYDIETAATPSLLAADTAQPGEQLHLSDPSNSDVYRFDAENETRVGVLFENRGDVADRFYVPLVVDDERVSSRSRFVEPGEHGVAILSLSTEDLERIAEADGTPTVKVIYGETRPSAEIALPKPER